MYKIKAINKRLKILKYTSRAPIKRIYPNVGTKNAEKRKLLFPFVAKTLLRYEKKDVSNFIHLITSNRLKNVFDNR